ncbi:hypothetical protein AM1_C0190 (plasmid) [Acaryochloris marina MBIC11017]|uniref:Uncharacterized protein n=1 Tax=Acaryochloris marina (strain MBIC 11017) TaxID=329726 RepID=A8ZMT0_ACAM1|nr:hypothetical protein AM1_C0190 [Acaryochloris marina MBIC11017]
MTVLIKEVIYIESLYIDNSITQNPEELIFTTDEVPISLLGFQLLEEGGSNFNR